MVAVLTEYVRSLNHYKINVEHYIHKLVSIGLLSLCLMAVRKFLIVSLSR